MSGVLSQCKTAQKRRRGTGYGVAIIYIGVLIGRKETATHPLNTLKNRVPLQILARLRWQTRRGKENAGHKIKRTI